MMISPETFYEMRLKGKTLEEIMAVIRSLKREIGRLKNIVEHPDYKYREWDIRPGKYVQFSMYREYLERAKQALIEAGGTYIPSAAEQKAMEFDDNIPYISKVEFGIGGFFGGYETKTYTIEGDNLHIDAKHTFPEKLVDMGNGEIGEISKEYFLDSLEDLHIGEWRRKYDCRRFGCYVMDGTQWHLDIYFSNGHRAVKIYGDNAYPHNFNRLLELFKME